MEINIVDHTEAKRVSSKTRMKTRPKWPALLLLLLLFVAFGGSGCADYYYGGYPGYGPYYGGYGGYGAGYGAYPGYAYPGSVTIAVSDRPYYVHGPGYWSGGAYYAWTPGYWGWSHHHRYWHHGYYGIDHRRY